MCLSDLRADALPNCWWSWSSGGACIKAVSDPDWLAVSDWRHLSHAMCVLPSVPEKRWFPRPVCFCVVRRGGDAVISRPAFPSSLLSLYLLLLGRKGLNVTAQDGREKRSVGLQAVGGQVVYPAVCESALFPKAALSPHLFLKYCMFVTVNLDGFINSCGFL